MTTTARPPIQLAQTPTVHPLPQTAEPNAQWQCDFLGTVRRVDHVYAYTSDTLGSYHWVARSFRHNRPVLHGYASTLAYAQDDADYAITQLLTEELP